MKSKIQEKIDKFLQDNQDDKYAQFSRGLIASCFPILGIRTKELEGFAKELLKEGISVYDIPLIYHEEIVIAGFMIAFSKENAECKVEKLKYLLPYIDNWGSCDMITTRLKGLESQKDFFVSLLKSDNAFTVRVAIVWLFRNLVKEHTEEIVDYFSQIDFSKFEETVNMNGKTVPQSYYIKMAIAWCYSEALIYKFDFMYKLLTRMEDRFIKLKTIQKACESYRIGEQEKQCLKALRG